MLNLGKVNVSKTSGCKSGQCPFINFFGESDVVDYKDSLVALEHGSNLGDFKFRLDLLTFLWINGKLYI